MDTRDSNWEENLGRVELQLNEDDIEVFFRDLSQLLFSLETNLEPSREELHDFQRNLCESLTFLLLLHEELCDSRPKIKETIDQIRIHIHDLSRKLRGTDESLAIHRTELLHFENMEPGRPKINISEESLLYFRDLGFSWKAISEFLMVSRWTIYRRIKEFGIENETGFSNITDEELDEVVRNFKSHHGIAAGKSLVTGHLRSIGLRIQQRRVVSSLSRIDPRGSQLRWRMLIKRRKYQVPGPNALWHIDGHHSLVNWGFVIHGCIDGYSRHIMYLECASNNLSTTVADLFDRAIIQFGVPSRVISDKGGENVLVWQMMEGLRGVGRGSYIAGSSVHNQRIERLWRDVWNYVACDFYYIFQSLEEQGMLSVSNERQMYILHYIFLPRINRVIESFVKGWNKHSLRTENNWTPEQLWLNGMMDKRNRQLQQVSELHQVNDISSEDISAYGIDWQGPSPTE